MALVIANEPTADSRAIVVFDPRQRQRALQAARRNSYFVKGLRFLLPIVTVALLGSYGAFLQFSTKIEDDTHKGTFNAGSLDVLAAQPTMRNPTYTGFNKKDGSEYTVRADRAIPDLDETKPIDLFGVSGQMIQKDGTVTKLTAKEGKFNRSASQLDLKDDIIVRTSNGMAAHLSTATIRTKEGLIVSDNPVAVRFPAGTLRGNKMTVQQKKRDIFFSDGVIANLEPNKADATKPGTSSANKKKARSAKTITAFATQSDKPVIVRAPTLRIKDAKSTARFSAGVIAIQGDAQLSAKFLDIDYAGDGSNITTAGRGSSINRIHAREDVVITRGIDRIATSRAEFDIKKDTSEFIGGVVITSGPDRKVISNRARINSAAETVLLTGQVVVTQGENVLRGTQLNFDQKRGRMILTDPSKPDGRIKVRLVNKNSGGAKVPKPSIPLAQNKKSAPATGFLTGQAFQARPNGPIDIEATRLEVFDKKHLATFIGEVKAAQGEFIVQTEILHATYTGTAGLTLGQPTPSGKNSANNSVQLQSIRAPKRIVVESTTGQYAAGDSGNFNLARNEIILIGNVFLRRGRQHIRGEKLVINTTTGLSRMENYTPKTWKPTTSAKNKPVQSKNNVDRKGMTDPNKQQVCGGRMCAMFYPGDLKKKKIPKAVIKTAPQNNTTANKTTNTTSVGSSWSAASTPARNAPSN